MRSTPGERIKVLFEQIGPSQDAYSVIEEARSLFHPDMVFKDPIQTLHGRDAFVHMNQDLIRRCRTLGFKVGTVLESEERIMMTWTMTMALRFGPALTIEGSTHLTLRDGVIVEHQDYWDLLGSSMDAVPLFGRVYRVLVKLLG